MDRVWNKIVSLKPNFNLLLLEEIFPQTHNLEYLRICYYNLYEKYLHGGIEEKDWKNKSRFIGRFPIEPFTDEYLPTAYDINSSGYP